MNRLHFINVYTVTRHYGGPEEGGWWYNMGEPIETRSIVIGPPPPWVPKRLRCGDSMGYPDISHYDKQRISEEMKMLEHRYQDAVCGDIYSVLGGQAIEVDHDTEPGKPWPEEIPYYC
jgi:hypothetical protein